jgi:nucleoside-diphosphate-sugar epimerase
VVNKIRVLVAGGAGFLGSVICESLADKGFEVYSFDKFPSQEPSEGVHELLGDLTRRSDFDRLPGEFDVVINAAAALPLKRDAAAHKSTNVDGNRILMEWAQNVHVRQYIYVSSSAVYGVPSVPSVSTSTPLKPFESYGKSKMEAEADGERFWADRPTVTYAIIRPRTIVGPGRGGIFASLFRWGQLGLPIPVISAGSNVYQFVHPYDVAELVCRVAKNNESGIFNLGGHGASSMKESLHYALTAAGLSPKFLRINRTVFSLTANFLRLSGLGPFAPYQIRMYGESLYFDDSQPTSRSSSEALAETFRHLAKKSNSTTQSGSSPHQTEPKFALLGLLAFFKKGKK